MGDKLKNFFYISYSAMSYFWKEQLPSINWHKHSQYKPNGILKRLSPSWGMNAVLLTDLTWTRIFSQLSFLSDKHLPSPLGSGYLISRLIYSQCGIYLNQWTLPRAIQKPRWDYYQHKVLVRMQWKSISFQCSGHKSLTLLLLRHY